MGISNDLISEFVKITKDDTPDKKESIVYGTAVKSDGSVYVRFDGSELLTPVVSTTNVADGERVTVMIKNHTAVVTGNISSPSARTGDVEAAKTELNKTIDNAVGVIPKWTPMPLTFTGAVNATYVVTEPLMVEIPVVGGEQGPKGDDGFSPVVSVEETDGGNKVTITDADGPKEFVVLDGEKGDTGETGAPGVGIVRITIREVGSPDEPDTPIDPVGTHVAFTDSEGKLFIDANNNSFMTEV